MFEKEEEEGTNFHNYISNPVLENIHIPIPLRT